jgi:hypothetical protein
LKERNEIINEKEILYNTLYKLVKGVDKTNKLYENVNSFSKTKTNGGKSKKRRYNKKRKTYKKTRR